MEPIAFIKTFRLNVAIELLYRNLAKKKQEKVLMEKLFSNIIRYYYLLFKQPEYMKKNICR